MDRPVPPWARPLTVRPPGKVGDLNVHTLSIIHSRPRFQILKELASLSLCLCMSIFFFSMGLFLVRK
mgnify:CR=1 FL=1